MRIFFTLLFAWLPTLSYANFLQHCPCQMHYDVRIDFLAHKIATHQENVLPPSAKHLQEHPLFSFTMSSTPAYYLKSQTLMLPHAASLSKKTLIERMALLHPTLGSLAFVQQSFDKSSATIELKWQIRMQKDTVWYGHYSGPPPKSFDAMLPTEDKNASALLPHRTQGTLHYSYMQSTPFDVPHTESLTLPYMRALGYAENLYLVHPKHALIFSLAKKSVKNSALLHLELEHPKAAVQLALDPATLLPLKITLQERTNVSARLTSFSSQQDTFTMTH